jgi:hypothetical protein
LLTVNCYYGIINKTFNTKIKIVSEELSNFQLKFGYWYLRNKIFLRKLGIGFLIFLCVALWGFSLYRGIMMLFVEQNSYRSMVNSLEYDAINYSYFRERNKPQQLQLVSSNIINQPDGKFDVIAQVINPNDNFVARNVQFELVSGANIIESKTITVYPGETRYVMFFLAESAQGGAQIRIGNIDWLRFERFADFADPRLRFAVTDIRFQTPIESRNTGQVPASTLSFSITNNSAFSYWEVGMIMILQSGGRPVAANYLTLDQLKSGEKREVVMRWYESLPSITQYTIVPVVDLINPQAYMPVE